MGGTSIMGLQPVQATRPHSGPVFSLLPSCHIIEILNDFSYVSKVQWNTGAHARSLEPQLTHSTASPTSLGQVLGHLLPSFLVPQATPGLHPVPASQAHSPLPRIVTRLHLLGEREERPDFCCHPQLPVGPGYGMGPRYRCAHHEDLGGRLSPRLALPQHA